MFTADCKFEVMSVVLLLVLPLLAEGSLVEAPQVKVDPLEEGSLVEVPPTYGGNCGLPPASTETFDCIAAGNTWHLQYQYRVPVLSDLGCASNHLSQGKFPNELHLNGSFSRIPAYPVEATIRMYGNRFHVVYHGIWNCAMSGPLNIVYCDHGFYILHSCFLGHDVSAIYTTARNPSEELLIRIWQAVENHPEVDKNKYVKVVC